MWKIIHTDIHNVAYGEHHPEDVQFSMNLDGVHSMTHIMDTSHHMATMMHSEPYATDFYLSHEGMDFIGGMITGATKNLEETGMQVAGMSWEHYFDERRHFPFNPDDPAQYVFVKVQQDITTIVEDMLDVVLAEPHSLELTYDNSPTGILRNFRIEPGDTTNILPHINSLAEQRPGFDHEITPDKNFIIYAPKKGNEIDFVLEEKKNVLDMGFDCTGVKGNSVLGLGAGSSQKLAKLIQDESSMMMHRRHDLAVEFGDIIDSDQLSSLTQAELVRVLIAHMGISVTTRPGDAAEILENVSLGDSMFVKGNLDYIMIDDYFRLTSMEGSINSQGEGTLTLRFDDATV